MKKLALSSLIAVFAVSGAHAANVIDGNPLYMPKAGHFYSVTDLSSHSENTSDWVLGEEFGYGVTNQLTVNVKLAAAEAAEPKPLGEDEMFDRYGVGNLALGATFRALDMKGWKVDAYGEYATQGAAFAGGMPTSVFAHSDMADDTFWFDKDLIDYKWTAGVRGGFVTPVFTLAGHVEYVYSNTESFNWGDDGVHAWKVGVDGQYVLCDKVNLVAGAEYTGITDDGAKNAGVWSGTFGVNYNIDATKFVGAYIKGDIDHRGGAAADEWQWRDGFAFGAKFGIDF